MTKEEAIEKAVAFLKEGGHAEVDPAGAVAEFVAPEDVHEGLRDVSLRETAKIVLREEFSEAQWLITLPLAVPDGSDDFPDSIAVKVHDLSGKVELAEIT